ncbi:MAG: hypothetical protein DRG09_03220 [Epsilonproteobacteria bacterium]|nr:MAG: hypothetical protein DRG09_03220 [Campylobacterota bacterium]
MKKIEVVNVNEIEVKPFILSDFTQNEASCISVKKMTKKELKELAESLDLVYDDTHIVFAKKLFNAYLTGKK